MGSKLEYILVVLILIVILIPFGVEVKNPENSIEVTKKKSEVNNFVEYELNATNLKHILKGKSAKELKEDNWYLVEPKMETNELNTLSAKSSIFNGKTIEFNKDVVAIKKDGIIYKSDKAIYELKTKNLITPNGFTIKRNIDIVRGKDLEYNPSSRVTKAKDVNGTFVLKKPKD